MNLGTLLQYARDPLGRFSLQTDYRREEIREALRRAADWVLTNRMPDGGFVFLRNLAFRYGHPALRGEAGEGAMFPTWFRTLALAIIGAALPDHSLHEIPWEFCASPGFQYWPATEKEAVVA